MSVMHSYGHLNQGVIDFNPTRLDQASFPVRTWNKMLKEALEQHVSEMGMYGDPQGEYGLRTVVSEYLRNSRGVISTPEQIVIGAGTAYSMGLLTKVLPGLKQIAVEEPGYSLVRDQFHLNGCDLLPITLSDKGISIDQLESSHAQLVYVTPSHQFPTGSIMPYPERERLLSGPMPETHTLSRMIMTASFVTRENRFLLCKDWIIMGGSYTLARSRKY